MVLRDDAAGYPKEPQPVFGRTRYVSFSPPGRGKDIRDQIASIGHGCSAYDIGIDGLEMLAVEVVEDDRLVRVSLADRISPITPRSCPHRFIMAGNAPIISISSATAPAQRVTASLGHSTAAMPPRKNRVRTAL